LKQQPLFLGAFAAALALAQPPGARIEIRHDGGAGSVVPIELMRTEMAFTSKSVKGAPFSAEGITESVQVLADGNRITRKNTTQMYRDSEGRVRRELSVNAVGPWATKGVEMVSIVDPVAKVTYMLEAKNKVARKLSFAGGEGKGDVILFSNHGPGAGDSVKFESQVRVEHRSSKDGANAAMDRKGPQPRTESLGKRVVEGIECDGTRSVVTIEANTLGNERAIEIVDERWFSPELQELVYSKHTDPRFGETTYRLSNIQRSEPSRLLFEPPADYKIEEPGKGVMRFERRMDGPGGEVKVIERKIEKL
jgi:hypothetical protein